MPFAFNHCRRRRPRDLFHAGGFRPARPKPRLQRLGSRRHTECAIRMRQLPISLEVHTLQPAQQLRACTFGLSGIAAKPASGHRARTMSKPIERIIKTNNISLHVVEAGRGPLVLLCHGFPESWYSWRHQIDALAGAALHAVAPDMRGCGKSARAAAIDQYTIFHLIGDVVGLLDAFGTPSAVAVGHDWGAGI